ncbi:MULTISPECIES: hypothetical protein [Streptomyces]|uniref:hypothetical protein n=1 Tax=Streptomyces TaxID=1883 RepID=UPI00084C1973|nr:MULTISPECIES: hypothetical protein [Streptomyces]TFI28036.1 hypothetical protein E4P36_10855 [Streptomyces sp. 4R-3d]
MSDVSSTADRDEEEKERPKSRREQLGGAVRGAGRFARTLAGGLARSRTTTYVGLAMMAAGAAMSLTGIGAVAGGPLFFAGMAVAGGSFALRRMEQNARGQGALTGDMRQSPLSTERNSAAPANQTPAPAAGRTAAPASDDLDVSVHLARATEALANVIQALAANQQQRQQQAAVPPARVQDNQNHWDRENSSPLTRTNGDSAPYTGTNIPMPEMWNSRSRRGSGSSSSSGASLYDSDSYSQADSSAPSPYRPSQARGKGKARGN